jgi:hypothetical protein
MALPNGIVACIFSFVETPKDAVRLAAASQRFRGIEQAVLYKRLTVRATNTAALTWMRDRGERILGGSIECDGAPLSALKRAYEAARATLLSPAPTPVRLVMTSKLFASILALLKRDATRMVELLKGHLQASVSGQEELAESYERQMSHMGFDSEYDMRSRASLAFVIDDVVRFSSAPGIPSRLVDPLPLPHL